MVVHDPKTATLSAPAAITQPDDDAQIRRLIRAACAGLDGVSPALLERDVLSALYAGATHAEIDQALALAARSRVEQEPNYSYVAARLMLTALYSEASGQPALFTDAAALYERHFFPYFELGVAAGRLAPELLTFDLPLLRAALHPERDLQFQLLGLQTIADRYLLRHEQRRFELPQLMFLRVAMGLALEEGDRDARAIEFYELLSSFRFMSATPTLFNSGTCYPQLSSCFLTTVDDDLDHIFKSIHDNAMLSKWAGGLGNDWTRVRAQGARIRSTNGTSLGIVPFLKVANDTAVAVNQCFAPETRVYTADGPKAIQDVRPGELVLGKSGVYRTVLDTLAYPQTDPMVEIDLKHAIGPVAVTAGHPFYAIRDVPLEQAGERTLRQLGQRTLCAEWVEAGQLRAGDYIAQVVPHEVVPVAGFTEEDARLYGIMLGDGHFSKGRQWGVSGNPQRDSHLAFVRSYLLRRGIHCWETARGPSYLQIHWAAGRGVVRDDATSRFLGGGAPTMPFAPADLYDAERRKRIARRFAHLPLAQTRALVQGLLETDGCVSRGTEITFTNSSEPLVYGLRYQLLRLGIPVSGQYREREQHHVGRRTDGSTFAVAGVTKAYDLRIPAGAGIAELVGCKPLTKRNWIVHEGMIFSRVSAVRPTSIHPVVHDLLVETDESYMTEIGLAHNGGKRQGAVCAYLEPWHLDIEEFLDLRKNTGDDRRRTHDMHTANWLPDLFLQRVQQGGQWTLFSPDETPDLHELYGAAFARRYAEYEQLADAGKLKNWRRLAAVDLWRKMITRLFETGHPWMTFKDPSNIRSPQDHAGVVHSSNLCTEILLNTSNDETAVCNLGSVNLAAHIVEGRLDGERLAATVRTALRMLDNVIEINLYPTVEAKNANLRHRPVGLGLMGFADALHLSGISYASDEALAFADSSMELISYHAILASAELAGERGAYSSYPGSKWERGLLPIDTVALLEAERGEPVLMDQTTTLDWTLVREAVRRSGMRNSNVMAIAPTATISNIVGVSQSIEPDYTNLYVKSNLSGDFTQVNTFLVRELQARGLWDADLLAELKYYDGSVQAIERIPAELRERHRTAFEIDPAWLIGAASRRQKWIDMGQSLNLYMLEPNGRAISELYTLAWRAGLKTTYYLRTRAATQIEKSTLDVNRFGVQPRWMRSASASNSIQIAREQPAPEPAVCRLDDPDCEACQ